jgi:hypothetical protein
VSSTNNTERAWVDERTVGSARSRGFAGAVDAGGSAREQSSAQPTFASSELPRVGPNAIAGKVYTLLETKLNQ